MAAYVTVNSPIERGGLLTCRYSGFTPNSQVKVYVQGGGYVMTTADSQGSGGVSFYISEEPGTYTLVAEEGSNYATAVFEVTPAGSIEPGEFRGYITGVSKAAGTVQGGPLKIDVSYEAEAGIPEIYAGWQTRVTGLFDGMSGSIQNTHLGSNVGATVTINVGTAPSRDLQGNIELYAKGMTGDWQLLSTQPVVIKAGAPPEIPVNGGNGGGGLPEISTPVGIAIIAALVLVIMLVPSRNPPREF
jgi:hypothetical protein